MSILILHVNGGEVTSFLGVYTNREALEREIVAQCEQAQVTEEDGYMRAEPEINEDGEEVIYVHYEGNEPWDYTLVFLVREVEVQS